MNKKLLEIVYFLEEKNLLKHKPPLWWPNVGSFEVVIGAVLTQNTTWKNVEKSLNNLEGFLKLDSFLSLTKDELKEKIKPSGFYNQKSLYLFNLARNIKKEFNDFENFKNKVSRNWLLNQKGIGEESADSILCYGCLKDEFVVDTYTKRLFKKYDIEFKKYIEYKIFVEDFARNNWDFLKKSYNSMHQFFALFHGMIVEYNKLKL